jgi:hypothetical protein
VFAGCGHAAAVDPYRLPHDLATGPFSTGEARSAGVAPSRLRRSDLVHPTRGVHARAVPTDLVARAAAFAKGLPPERAFSHVTAAALLGLPLPRRLEKEAAGGPLHVIAPTPDGQTRRVGCAGHRGLESRRTTEVHGLSVVAAEDTWVDLGECRPPMAVDELVVTGDAVVAMVTSGTADAAWRLRRPLETRVRPRGKVRLLEALGLVRPGVRSAMESRARLVCVRGGLPEPEVNGDITDAGGEWLAEGDLVWRGSKVVGEYQGADHASRRRRSLDASRRASLEMEDWRVVEIWAEDVYVGGRRTALLLRLARELGVPSTALVL